MAVVISSDLVIAAGAGNVQPLTHARIMYQNVLQAATLTGSTSTAGFEADATQNYDTYSWWIPQTVPATLTYRLTEAKEIDYVLLAGHSLGSSGAAVIVEKSDDGATWSELAPERIPADDTPIAFLFDEVTTAWVRIRVTSATSSPRISVVMSGKALAMQRAIYGGHSPINLSRQTEVRPTRSEGGQWLGRSVVRKGFSTSYKWKNLTAAWYRQYFDPFVRAARVQPFGIAWRPESHPDEVAYAWTNSDIQPENSGLRDLMDVSITVEAHDTGVG